MTTTYQPHAPAIPAQYRGQAKTGKAWYSLDEVSERQAWAYEAGALGLPLDACVAAFEEIYAQRLELAETQQQVRDCAWKRLGRHASHPAFMGRDGDYDCDSIPGLDVIAEDLGREFPWVVTEINGSRTQSLYDLLRLRRQDLIPSLAKCWRNALEKVRNDLARPPAEAYNAVDDEVPF